MFEQKYFNHLMKAKYAAQSLNEQLKGSKDLDLKIVPKKVRGKNVKKWYLTLS